MATVRRSTLTIRSRIGTSRKRPGPLAGPRTLPREKMTPRSYSLTMRTALANKKTTNSTTTKPTIREPNPIACNNPTLTFKLLVQGSHCRGSPDGNVRPDTYGRRNVPGLYHRGGNLVWV